MEFFVSPEHKTVSGRLLADVQAVIIITSSLEWAEGVIVRSLYVSSSTFTCVRSAGKPGNGGVLKNEMPG